MKDFSTPIKKVFQRSINIVSDLDNRVLLETFLPSTTGNNTLLEFCTQIQSKQGAFTWTGAYGSGKSTLAVILLSLLRQKNSNIYNLAEQAVSEEVSLSVNKTFGNFKKRTIISLVAPTGNLDEIISQRLKEAFSLHSSKKTTIELIEELIKDNQILIVIDELGKYLEDAAKNNRDIFILQQLAEIANRSDGQLIVLGILHQSFSAYTEKFDKTLREEWQKIQGRFLDIPVNITVGEQLALIALCLDNKMESWLDHDPFDSARDFVNNLKKQEKWIKEETLIGMYPLNIVASILMANISKKTFSQNQRTLFSFLSSAEPLGFRRYVDSADKDQFINFSASNLWDYLALNFESQIINTVDGYAWIVARECLSRLEASQSSEMERLCIKTIAMLQIFGDQSFLKPNLLTIKASLLNTKTEEIKETLASLLKKKLIFFRDISDTYHLSEATDFELDEEIKPFISDEFPNTEQLNTLLNLRPIIGKRHYIETGNIRWFDIQLIHSRQLETLKNSFDKSNLYIVLGEGNEKRGNVLKQLSSLIKNSDYPTVVSYPVNSSIISKNIKQLFALRSLQKENQLMQVDKVARRKVEEEVTFIEALIENDLENSFVSADWCFSKENDALTKKIKDENNLNQVLSKLFDLYYTQAPIIKNELANKSTPSPQANSALRKLMLRCIENEQQPALGFSDTKNIPPERTIYNAIIEKFSLHEEPNVGEASFINPVDKIKGYKPSKDKDLQNKIKLLRPIEAMWKVALKAAKEVSEVNVVDIIKIWTSPPFGLKEGLGPLFILLFYLTNRKNIAMYNEGVFLTELDETTPSLLLRATKDFSFKYSDYSTLSKKYEWLAKTVATELNRSVEPTPLSIGRALVMYLNNECPAFTKSTTQLTPKTLSFKNELVKASDPNDLVIDKVIKNFSNENEFRKSLQEIINVFKNKMQDFRNILLEEFDVLDETAPGVILRERAEAIKGKTGNLMLEPFIMRLARLNDRALDFEDIMQAVLKKDAKQMIDLDVDRGAIELKSLIFEFKKAEQFISVKARKKKAQAISILYGGVGKAEPIQKNFSLNKKQMEASKNVLCELEELQNKHGDDEVIFGAIAEFIEKNYSND